MGSSLLSAFVTLLLHFCFLCRMFTNFAEFYRVLTNIYFQSTTPATTLHQLFPVFFPLHLEYRQHLFTLRHLAWHKSGTLLHLSVFIKFYEIRTFGDTFFTHLLYFPFKLYLISLFDTAYSYISLVCPKHNNSIKYQQKLSFYNCKQK